MTSTFLFRPFVISDVTSPASLFAGIENILWLAAFVYIFWMIAKKRKIPFFEATLPSIIFLILYAVGAGSYEGNMGTAFRHKSLILWVVLSLILAVSWRQPTSEMNQSRAYSQEGAV